MEQFLRFLNLRKPKNPLMITLHTCDGILYVQRGDHQTINFYNCLDKTIRTVVSANIIGDTLYTARKKLFPIEIRPYEIDNVVVGGEEDYRTDRCNVAICNGIITRIIHYG